MDAKKKEELFIPLISSPLDCQSDDPAIFLLRRLRDEAHRFAIAGHRNQRQRARTMSELESIDGVGPKRRRQLLTHFGSLAGVKGASEQEIAKVDGISHAIAREIYQTLHH